MVFFIYQLGSLASVWAISNLIKKDVPQRIKNKIIVLLLVTSWIGVFGYFFILFLCCSTLFLIADNRR